MKRDMELVREILLAVEADRRFGDSVKLDLEGRRSSEVSYHVMVLAQAGLLEARGGSVTSGPGAPQYTPVDLTWEGHEFLDLIRSKRVWDRIKPQLAKIGAEGFGTVQRLAERALVHEFPQLFQ